MQIAVDTLGHLLALTVTPALEGDRGQVEALAEEVQQVTGANLQLAYVDQGYTGPNPAQAADEHGLRLKVVTKQRIWEIKVKSILKLDRAEQAAAEKAAYEEHEEIATEESPVHEVVA